MPIDGSASDQARAIGFRWAPIVAGLFAAIGVALTQEWSYYMFRGTSEPMLVGASLWAVDRHLAGRYKPAFILGVAASLIRPEAWPFVFLYAIWLWRRERTLLMAAFVLVGLAAIPFFWFVPPWIGTGQPFIAATHAKDYNGHLGAHPFIEVLRRGDDLQPAPWLILGLAAVAIAWFRAPRNRLVLGLDRGRGGVVGAGRRDDPRRISRARALLPACGGAHLRPRRARARTGGRLVGGLLRGRGSGAGVVWRAGLGRALRRRSASWSYLSRSRSRSPPAASTRHVPSARSRNGL